MSCESSYNSMKLLMLLCVYFCFFLEKGGGYVCIYVYIKIIVVGEGKVIYVCMIVPHQLLHCDHQ
jgi:hypothetical protein